MERFCCADKNMKLDFLVNALMVNDGKPLQISSDRGRLFRVRGQETEKSKWCDHPDVEELSLSAITLPESRVYSEAIRLICELVRATRFSAPEDQPPKANCGKMVREVRGTSWVAKIIMASAGRPLRCFRQLLRQSVRSGLSPVAPRTASPG